MFLNFFPLFAMNFKSLKKPKMLIFGPSTRLMGDPAELLEGYWRLLYKRTTLLERNLSKIVRQHLLLLLEQQFVFFKNLGGLLFF
jgi:hypothetical protein